MAGRDAIVLVTDRRLGRGLALLDGAASRPVWNDRQCYGSGNENLSTSSPTTWLMTGTGLPGDLQSLQTDVQVVLQGQTSPLALALPSSITSSPTSISLRSAIMLVSHLLYQQRRYLVQSILVGFDQQQQPMLCTMDTLGATSITQQYACVGGAAESLWGSAARYWQPNLSTENLIKRAVSAFGAGIDRNILSGYGAVVHILTRQDGIWDCRIVTSRND
jgi:20S proteasome subunit beta 3